MGSNFNVEIGMNSVPQPKGEAPGPSEAPKNASAEQPRGGDVKREGAGSPESGGRLRPWADRAQVAVVGAVIVLVWCLLALPIVFYYLPNDTASAGTSGGSTCEQASSTRYTGTVCREPLQSCLNPPGAGDIYVALTVDEQIEAEQRAMLLELGLSQASDECRQAALPFACLYLFGLCSGNGTLHSPSEMDCLHVSTELCAAEWAAGQSQGLPLPECSTLSDQPTALTVSSCVGRNSVPANTTASPPTSSPTAPTASVPSGASASTSVIVGTNCTVQCRDAFYCTANNTCRPQCGSWKELSQAAAVVTDVVVIISASVGVISGAVVLIITCIRRKQLLVFPAIIVPYMTAILVISASVVLISYVDRTGLYCSSIDLQMSIENTTQFCNFAGVIFYYTLLQVAIWGFSHVAILFWRVQFPFHARRFERAHRMKYLHIGTLLTALFIPVIPVMAEVLAGGFAITRFPPILCTGTSSEATFYALALPIIVILQVGITMLILIFWTIHKHRGPSQDNTSKPKQPIKLSTPEKKILIAFCYYVILGAIALTAFTLTARNTQDFIQNVLLYFVCEQGGIDPSNSCERSTFEDLANPELVALAQVLMGLFPVVNLIYVIDVKMLSQYCHKRGYRSKAPGSAGTLSVASSARVTTHVQSSPSSGTLADDHHIQQSSNESTV